MELVSGGVTLIGNPPERNFGYEGFPAGDEEFHQLMFGANKEIVEDYYEHLKQEINSIYYDVYFNKNFNFRGARHV